MLDALDAVGLRGDGRLIQLNSYENRVFQVFLEDGRVVVAKFYRPGRWSDAQILEEHAFAAELAAAEIPVASPLAARRVDPRRRSTPTARHCSGRRWHDSTRPPAPIASASASAAPGARPSSRIPRRCEWLGRFIGRIHAVGASVPLPVPR